MTVVIAVTNLKGGVGKTTLTTNLAVAFLQRDYRVCIVDTDIEQRSSMEWSGNRDETLPSVPVFGVTFKQLNKEIQELKKNYDLIFIDGTPQLAEVADRTILASDVLIIPVLPSLYDLRGFENFLDRFIQVKDLKEASGGEVRAFVVLNRINPNTIVSKEIEAAIADHEVEILNTKVVNRIAYVDTATMGKGVLESTDRNADKAKKEMTALVSELEALVRVSV